MSLRKRSFASSERVRDLGGKAEMVDGSSRQRARKRSGGQRWWMGVADRARARSGGVEMCRASREACRVVCRGLCALSRESRVAVPVVQCHSCGLCYVARGVAAPPRSRRSCSVGEAPLVVIPNSWPQRTRRRRAPPGHAKAQGRSERGAGTGAAVRAKIGAWHSVAGTTRRRNMDSAAPLVNSSGHLRPHVWRRRRRARPEAAAAAAAAAALADGRRFRDQAKRRNRRRRAQRVG